MTRPYVIIEGQTIRDLVTDVPYHIELGYVPIGGVCVGPPDQHGESYLLQALINPELVKG